MLAVWIVAYIVCGIATARILRSLELPPDTTLTIVCCWPLVAIVGVVLAIAIGTVWIINKLP